MLLAIGLNKLFLIPDCVTPVRNGNLGSDRTTTIQVASVENNWVRNTASVTRADRRRMVELMEETGVQWSLTERLVR